MKLNLKKVLVIAAIIMIPVSAFIFINIYNENKEEEKLLMSGNYTKSYKFDFGIDESKRDTGFNTITVSTKKDKSETYFYNEKRGYGFKKGNEIYGMEDGLLKTSIDGIKKNTYLDYAIANGAEFLCDLENGNYDVSFIIGTFSYSKTDVICEGKTLKEMGKDGEVNLYKISDVDVLDGQMNIKFSGSGVTPGIINAILITPNKIPSGLKAEKNNEYANISFDKIEGVSSYNIYRKDIDNSIKVIANTKKNSYKDKTVSIGEEYTYFFTGVYETGLETKMSKEKKISYIDKNVKAPNEVTNFKYSYNDSGEIVLSWDKDDLAKSYKVYHSDRLINENDLEAYSFIAKTDGETINTGIKSINQVYFKIIALNEGGSSNPIVLKVLENSGFNVQIEKMDRGLKTVTIEKGVYVSFRINANEYKEKAVYEIYRNEEIIQKIDENTNSSYLDLSGKNGDIYYVKTYIKGELVNTSEKSIANGDAFLEIPLNKPSDNYQANDASVGDVDGDGEYEIFLKWEPNDAQDNSKSGKTSNVFIDAYKMDGSFLYRIDLGKNIRAGAHYTQFLVYDFDGDSKAELMLKTADGTVDGVGNVIGDKNANYQSESGYVLSGPEFLTLFEGSTGKALDTISYIPERGKVSLWGDEYGNRVDRFLAGVAYLNGETPSAIFARGYYTRAVIASYNVVGKKIITNWICDSNNEENKGLFGQGAHSLSTADIDMDGKDEIIYGSATVDDNGKLLYAIKDVNVDGGGGHGDALHVGDFDLSNPGLEVFMVHEESPNNAGIEMHDGISGKYLYSYKTLTDIGRGCIADIDPNYKGSESFADKYMTSADGKVISSIIPPANFVIYWDGDLGREILDHDFSKSAGKGTPIIYKWDYNNKKTDVLFKFEGTSSNNYTKGNPCLSADLFGDWREEVILRSSDNKSLRIYMGTEVMDYRIYSLMQDVQYRNAVAAQNSAYNQPPHTSFYIGFDKNMIEIPIKNWK